MCELASESDLFVDLMGKPKGPEGILQQVDEFMEIVKTKIQESDERHSVIRKQIEELDRMELEK
jgi:hypothetical protein